MLTTAIRQMDGENITRERVPMRIKRWTAGALSALLLTAGTAAAFAAPSYATDAGTCTPADAWVEHVQHPAVGTPTITIVNVAYIPAVEEVSHEVNHPAVPDQTVADGFEKWTWHDAKVAPTVAPTVAPPSDGWKSSGHTEDTKGATPDTILQAGNGHGSWFYFQSLTKTIPGTPAWTETVIDVPGSPAVGTPTIEIPNPAYVAPWTEDVDHPAVTCDTPAPTLQQCTTTGSTQFTSLADWTMTETRATGHNDLVDGGLHVWTEGATSTDKAAGYYPAAFDLRDAGAGFGVIATGTGTAQPSLQLLTDLDGNGTPEGYLVSEPVYGADTLWLSSNWTHLDLTGAPATVNGGGTGLGGTANAWLAAFPDAKVYAIGYSLGSGVQGDWTITAITAGCHTYTFTRPDAPATPEPTTVTTYTDWTGDEPTCDEPSVEQTRTASTVTTTYAAPEWANGAWVEDTTGTAGEPVVTTETRTVTYQGDDCAVVIPPTPTPTPTVTPTVTPKPTPHVTTPAAVDDGELAATGGSGISPWALSSGALAVALGAGLVLLEAGRRHRRQQ